MTRRTSAVSRRQRAQVEAVIEHLIALLDTLDGDADAEPILGSLEAQVSVPWGGMHWWPSPVLCSAGGREFRTRDGSQSRWGASSIADLEDEHDGREPDEDVENDPAEMGIADLDALQEQCAGVL